jgi:membrane fusion protein (multidrug efflux system)
MFSRKMALVLVCSLLFFGTVFWLIERRKTMQADELAHASVPAVSVTIARAAQQDWPIEMTAIGTLEARHGVDVSASVPGLVQQILFESGQTVKRGEPLVRLDSEIELGNLKSAQAQLDLANATLERTHGMKAGETVSRAAIDRDEAGQRIAAANVAALAAIIAKKTIAAPFDGVIGIRKVNLGQYLEAGHVIANLQDYSVILANFSVSQREMARLAIGQTVRATTDAYPGRSFEGKLSVIESQIDADSAMVKLQARFENADGLLRPGMFIRATVELGGQRKVVTVPQTAISYTLYANTVYVVDEQSSDDGSKQKKVRRIPVKPGERRGDVIAVDGQLKPGDLVVTSGQVKLSDDSVVEVTAADVLKPPAAMPKE